MDMDPWVEKFEKEALPEIIRQLRPDRVLIFGSRAKGIAREESDLDILIVSGSFQEVPFLRRMPMLMKMVPFPKHIDYLCYTPDEFNRVKNASSILSDALIAPLELPVS